MAARHENALKVVPIGGNMTPHHRTDRLPPRRCSWPFGCLTLFTLAHAATPAAMAAAQQPGAENPYPDRPIRIVVGFTPGGSTDMAARTIGHKLSESLGQPVVIENRPGAAGNLATGLVAKATPDGHTLLMGTIDALAINPALYGNLPYNALRDFAPITQAVNAANMFVVHPAMKAHSVKDFISFAKSNPGKASYGSAGSGASGHLAGELFSAMARIKMTHIPYKGNGPVMTELIAGNVPCAFAPAATAMPNIAAGKLRPLGVTTAKRSSMIPDIPTIAEQGLPGFDANHWYGLLAPAGTPLPLIQQLNAEITKVLKQPEVRQYFHSQGLDPAPSSPREFAGYIRTESTKWSKVVREINVAVQ
jgi:tripartite-type tricarboxylate transporter receptor subunit TctC